MTVLPVVSANPATQFWIGARSMEALVLLVVLLRLSAPPSFRFSFIAPGIVSLLIIASVWLGIFPDAFVEPTGLTTFKIISEYVIIAILAVCLVLLGHKRDLLHSTVVAPLGMVIILTMASELAFTFYVDVYDLSNLIGHILKLFAFWLILISVVRTTFAQPFSLLKAESLLQRATARNLRESEERLQVIMEKAQDGIVMVNHNGMVIYWNEAAHRMFGYTEAEIIGQDVHEILANPGDLPMIKHQVEEFSRSGQGPVIGATLALEGRHKDGTLIPVELAVAAVHDKKEWAAIATIRDLTERMEAERLLRQMQKSEAIEGMAAGIAHDFKNMLFPIISLTDMCMKSLPDDSRDYIRLEKVLEAANRAASLARRILDFTREEVPVVKNADLSALVAETIDFMRSTTLKNITIKADIEADLVAVIDTDQIRNVIINLVSNAADATGVSTGTISITLFKHVVTLHDVQSNPMLETGMTYAVLTVADHGIGMDEKTLSRIFDPFFTTKDVGKGTGLGLAVAHSIVTKHGGVIGVKSKPNKGSTFTVHLPLASTPASTTTS